MAEGVVVGLISLRMQIGRGERQVATPPTRRNSGPIIGRFMQGSDLADAT